jgi:hypothetical protein
VNTVCASHSSRRTGVAPKPPAPGANSCASAQPRRPGLTKFIRYVRPFVRSTDHASSGLARRSTCALVPPAGRAWPGGCAGGSGAITRSVNASVVEFASAATRIR